MNRRPYKFHYSVSAFLSPTSNAYVGPIRMVFDMVGPSYPIMGIEAGHSTLQWMGTKTGWIYAGSDTVAGPH